MNILQRFVDGLGVKFNLLTNTQLNFFTTFLCLFMALNLSAEGTKQVSPTEDDWSLLQLREGFANYGTAGTSAGMCIEVLDPTEEVYIGLSMLGYSNYRRISNVSYDFRILDELGNVVHGPFTVTSANANGTNYDDVVAGPDLGSGVGYDISDPMFHFSPSATGTYCIEFDLTTTRTGGFLNEGIVWWDFTVTDSAGSPQLGRLFSENWSFRNPTDNDPDIFNQPFKGMVFVLTDGGFVHEVDFKNSGFRGLTFRLAFNTSGPGTTGVSDADRQSVNGVNATNPQFEIFLNDPDTALYTEAGFGAIVTGPFLQSTGPCDTLGGFCVNFEVSQPGLVEIILDMDGADGIYTPDSRDRILLSRASGAGPFSDCIPWDKKDGEGNSVDPFEGVPLFMRYSQGETHFMIHDLEYNNPGFTSKVIHPSGGIPNDLFYYDDSELDPTDNDANIDLDNNPATGVNPSLIELNGCNPPCHIWNRNTGSDTRGFGESNTINTWWTGSVIVFPVVIEVLCKQDTLSIEKEVVKIANGTSGTQGNFDVSFEILLKNDGTTIFDSLQIVEDMAANFGASYVGLVSPPVIIAEVGTPILPNASSVFSPNIFDGINTLYNGDTNVEMLDSTAILQPGEKIAISLVVELSPYASGAIYHSSGYLANQASVSGLFDCAWVSDLSDEGTDPTDTETPQGINNGTLGDTGGSNDETLFPLEFCGNGKDDDFDGLTDIDDDDCDVDCSFSIAIEGGCNNISIVSPLAGWTYEWYKNGAKIVGATGESLIPTVPEEGDYYSEITTSEGCFITSNTLTISNCCDPTEPVVNGVF